MNIGRRFCVALLGVFGVAGCSARLDPATAALEKGDARVPKGDVGSPTLNPSTSSIIYLGPFPDIRSHLARGDYDKAIMHCNGYILANPNNPEMAVVYAFRAFAYQQKGDLGKAIADYNEAIRLDPKRDSAYLNRGGAYIKTGEYDKAIADCTEAIRLNPELADAYYHRGQAYDKKGEKSKAEADFAEAEKLGFKPD